MRGRKKEMKKVDDVKIGKDFNFLLLFLSIFIGDITLSFYKLWDL